ncbi:MAG: hypothetical protein GYB67_15625 [Chloroflexi bacterium]|nr:hypothetical protein [Chloroflexota bacterium]
MRRVGGSLASQAEWMAPDDVVNQVITHYLEAINWLHESTWLPRVKQFTLAPVYLTGKHLKRHQHLIASYRPSDGPEIAGVLRADHQVEVRRFSPGGETCLVIDHQRQRRMATYDARTKTRVHTQDLGDGVIVYRMAYEARGNRWKIDAFIQELPLGWETAELRQHIQELVTTPPVSVDGRCN